MPEPRKIIQPKYMSSFRCIGADCEDTCCVGWGVSVDKTTFEKYRDGPDQELKSSLGKIIKINADETDDDYYATIEPTHAGCPFLSQGLCSIHGRLGEDHLPIICASFPRVTNAVNGILERTGDMSCPEAARLALLPPDRMGFSADQVDPDTLRLGQLSSIDASVVNHKKPYRFLPEVRALAVSILQNRSFPLWKRLIVLGHFCDALHGLTGEEDDRKFRGLFESYAGLKGESIFQALEGASNASPELRMTLALELLVARIASEHAGPRFMECYKEFIDGLGLKASSTTARAALSYARAHRQYYEPFTRNHGHMLEHYLVNYVYQTLFPFGPQDAKKKLRLMGIDRPISAQYRLMLAYYFLMETLLVGMSAFHRAAFGVDHVIRLVQSFTKTFVHSPVFPAKAVGILDARGMATGAAMAVLLKPDVDFRIRWLTEKKKRRTASTH